MSAAIEHRLVTTDEFLRLVDAAPDDVTWELIDGEVRERPMTTRSPRHSTAIAHISHVLLEWLEQHTEREGEVAAGEARCRIRRNPDSIVGLDVAYFEGAPIVELEDGSRFFDGPPVVAVEVLSATDTHESISKRISELLVAGVAQVWKADPDFRTITVYRRDADPALFSGTMSLTAEPELPGLTCEVARLFRGKMRA